MRVLPLCRHYFHPDCVAQWLSINKASGQGQEGRQHLQRRDCRQLLPMLGCRRRSLSVPPATRQLYPPPSFMLCRYAASATARCLRRARKTMRQGRQQQAAAPAACLASAGGSSTAHS